MSERSDAILAVIDEESSNLAKDILGGITLPFYVQDRRDRLDTLRADLALELQGGPK